VQREDALRRATAVRRQRAQLKRDLKAGRCAIEDVLTDPPAFVQTAKVADLLLALPKHGPVTADIPAQWKAERVQAQRIEEDYRAVVAGWQPKRPSAPS
jgi:hypothetical protein